MRFKRYPKYIKETKDGPFEFKRVPPGKAKISREIRVSDRMRRISHSIFAEVKAGETVHVSLGGTGRPVVGRVLVPEVIEDQFDWQSPDYRLSIESVENPHQPLACEFEPDGAFCIDDVPAGHYCLRLNAYGPPAEPRRSRGEPIGILSCPFTVPEMPGGRSDEPLDLGQLELQPIGTFAPMSRLTGKALPSFKGIRIDFVQQQALDKRILICFFDMHQRPSRRLLSQLAQRANQLQAKGIAFVAVQGAGLDGDKLNEWVRENDIALPIGMITGDHDKTRFAWGVKSLPWLILTDEKHIVQAEGFGINQLDDILKQDNGD